MKNNKYIGLSIADIVLLSLLNYFNIHFHIIYIFFLHIIIFKKEMSRIEGKNYNSIIISPNKTRI